MRIFLRGGGSSPAISPNHFVYCSVNGTYPTAPRIPRHKKAFYAAGRYWLFIGNYLDNYIDYMSSTDGVTWTALTSTGLALIAYDANWDLHYDGTYIHIAREYLEPDNNGLAYRRATPNADGTITWSAAEQVINNHDQVIDFSMSEDSLGRVWICGGERPVGGSYTPTIYVNDHADGTWHDATGFPKTFSASDMGSFPVPIAMTSGKMYVVRYRNGYGNTQPLIGEYYSGSTWTSEGDVTSAVYNPVGAGVAAFDIAAYGDRVDLLFVKNSDGKIYHKQRSSGGSWGSETLVEGTYSSEPCSPVLCCSGSTLYALWQDGDSETIYLRKYDGSSWGSLVKVRQALQSLDYTTLQTSKDLENGKIPITYQDESLNVWHFLYAPS